MDKKILGQMNQENADLICARINQDADEEVRIILEKAGKEKKTVLAEAQKFAEGKKQEILRSAEQEIRKSREKILSSLNLEKKRLVLSEKDKYVQSVLAEVRKTAENWRKDSGYPEFLENSIIEGINVIAESNITVYYSRLDEHFLSRDFIGKVEKACAQVLKTDCSLKFNKADFIDLGVIVNSTDGRMSYDNRFLARLDRAKEEIYMELLKQSF